MTITEKTDASRNKELLDIWYTDPTYGYIEVIDLYDFTNKIFYDYVPSLSECDN